MGRRWLSVILRSEAAKPPSPRRICDSEIFEARVLRTRAPQDDGRRASSPAFFDRPREGRTLFPFPEGNGAPGGARGLRDPFEPPLRSGSPRAGFRRRGCEARPGRAHHDCGGFARPAARVLRLPALHLAARARLTRRLDRGARDVSPRAARPPGLSRLETGKDRRLIKTTYSYIGGLSRTPACTREAPRAAIPAARLLLGQDDPVSRARSAFDPQRT